MAPIPVTTCPLPKRSRSSVTKSRNKFIVPGSRCHNYKAVISQGYFLPQRFDSHPGYNKGSISFDHPRISKGKPDAKEALPCLFCDEVVEAKRRVVKKKFISHIWEVHQVDVYNKVKGSPAPFEIDTAPCNLRKKVVVLGERHVQPGCTSDASLYPASSPEFESDSEKQTLWYDMGLSHANIAQLFSLET